jgi:hypothetical protein
MENSGGAISKIEADDTLGVFESEKFDVDI